MDNRCGVAVILSRQHDAVFAVAGMKDGDADHQSGGEVPATGVSDRKGLRHRSGSCLGGGDHPRATGARCVWPRAAITAQAKPERPHARVVDPLRVDGDRPRAGPRISADGSGVLPDRGKPRVSASTDIDAFVHRVRWSRRFTEAPMAQRAQDMAHKLVTAGIIGMLIIVVVLFVLVGSTDTVGPANERTHLAVEALKDVGVVVIGIAVIEVVWIIVGGAPTEQAMNNLLSQLRDASRTIREDVGSVRIEVTAMSKLAASGQGCGLVDIAEGQDKLKYDYNKFIDSVLRAKQKIQICGAALDFLYSSDDALSALSQRASEGLEVEVILPDDENPVVMAIFQDRFEEHIRRTAKSLATQITNQAPKIKLQRVKNKALTITMIRIDNEMLVTPYLLSRQTAESPRLLISGSDMPLFRVYENEFQKLADS